MAERPAPSTKPILEKLRYTPGQRALILNVPDAYAPILEGIEYEDRLDGQFDFIHVFVTRRADVQRDAPAWRDALTPNGILWISYPKGKAIATDLNRDSLYRMVLEHGLQGVSQVAIDDVWSALRFKRS
jgi:hypothetical protein